MKNIYDLDNKEVSTLLGQMLKSARIAANLTQKDLSEKSKVALMTISGFESGRSSVSLLTLIQLLRILGKLELLEFPSLAFSSSNLDDKPRQRVRPPSNSQPAEKEDFSITQFRLEPLNINKNYLLTRQITAKTLSNTIFCGSILQGNKKNNDNQSNHVIYPFKTHPTHPNSQMLTILQQYENKIEGEKEQIDKYFSSDNEKNNSLWFSNMPEIVELIYIFENPLDALSHFQIFNKQNALYCATGGKPTNCQIALFMDLCAELRATPILCFDNNLTGCRCDTNFLETIHPDKISIIMTEENFFHIKLSKLKYLELNTITNYLNIKHIKIIEKLDDTIIALIDNPSKAFEFNIFTNNFYLKSNIIFEKSKKNNYNEALNH